VNPDGSTLAVGVKGRVLLLDSMTLTERVPPLQHVGSVRVAWSHDGSKLLTTSVEGAGIIWEADTGAERLRFGQSFEEGGFSPDDRSVITGAGGELAVWNATSSSVLLSAGRATTSGTVGLELSLPAPDGRTLARAAGQRLWFVDSASGRETARTSTARTVWRHVWSPDSSKFLTVSPGVLSLWDPGTGRLVDERRYAMGVGVVAAFSPHADRIYVHDRDGSLETLDATTLERSFVPTQVGDVVALLPDPRDDTVLGLLSNGAVVRVDPEAGRVLATGPVGMVAPEEEHAGVLSPDGSLMVAPHPKGVMRLLDTDTFEWVGVESPIAWGGNVAYAPDGSQFASADADRVRLWDGRTGAYLGGVPLPGPAGSVKVSYVSGGGGLLVAASDGRTWTVDTRRTTWVDRACRIVGRNLAQEEWALFFPGRPYEVTCSQWQAGT
jgi:WD40 repeat protein